MAALRTIEKGMSRRRTGAIAIAVLVFVTYFAFAKDIPFTHGYQLTAYFKNASNIKPNSPVRVAGMTIGEVKKVEHLGASGSVAVKMELKGEALPIHSDATAKIRPRLFLEGNFFIDLKPGSPSGRELKSGGTLPVAQTATQVQFDQLLSVFDIDTRDGLVGTVQGYGEALNGKPSAADNADQDPDVSGKTGAQSINGALVHSPETFRGAAKVFDALNGKHDSDFSDIQKGLTQLSEGLNKSESQLTTLFQNFDTTVAAFSSDEAALTESTKEFSRLAVNAAPAFKNLKTMFPALTGYSNALAGNISGLPATIEAASPWVDQTTELLGPKELQPLARDSKSTISHFASAADTLTDIFPQLRRVSTCYNDVLFPTLMSKIDDGPLSNDAEAFKNFWYSLVGMAGESSEFDGNGSYLRLGGGGDNLVRTPGGKYVGFSVRPQQGIRPGLPSANPPFNKSTPCYKNAPANLNGPAAALRSP